MISWGELTSDRFIVDRQGAFITQPGRRRVMPSGGRRGMRWHMPSSDWDPAILAEAPVCLVLYRATDNCHQGGAHSLTHVTQHLQSEELQEICSQGFLSPICHCQILRQGSRSHSYLVMWRKYTRGATSSRTSWCWVRVTPDAWWITSEMPLVSLQSLLITNAAFCSLHGGGSLGRSLQSF